MHMAHSVPHKLIEMSMDTYHASQHIKKIVKEYFGGIQIRFTVGKFTASNGQQPEKGIVT